MKKNYSSVIIEILLILSIMLATLAIFLKYVVLDKNTYLNILNENGTYEQIKDSIYIKIDDVLSAKNINIDIKESIITDEDIKKEADNLISGLIQYLETGENNIKPVDVDPYKQRVKDIIGNIIKPTKNEVSFNSNVQAENIVYEGKQLKYNNMMVYKEQSKVGQSSITVQKLDTRSEAEAKVREILRQKGLTEEQAIEKATKKGITEEQALKILADYGITIDEETDPKGNQSTSNNSDDSNASAKQGSYNTAESPGKEAPPNGQTNSQTNSQTENAINEKLDDKSIKNSLDGILNKLLDEAGSSIEKEVEKINLNKILESSKIQELTLITSIIYKMFWMFMILPIILMAILIKINGKNLNSSLKYIRNAFLVAGLILFAIFFGAYALKVYEKININAVYIKDIIFYTIKHFLIVLSKFAITIFFIGLFLFIPTIKKTSKRN